MPKTKKKEPESSSTEVAESPTTPTASAFEGSTLRSPPSTPVKWLAKPTGVYYDHETGVSPAIMNNRLYGVVIETKRFFDARRTACVLLQLSEEHVSVVQEGYEDEE